MSTIYDRIRARRLELGGFLRLGKGEELSGGREKSAVLADALAALNLK